MKKNFSLDSKEILFIAEIGGNHEGDFNYAKRLVGDAISSGVQVVKLQTYYADKLTNKLETPDRYNHFKNYEVTMSVLKLTYCHLIRSNNVKRCYPSSEIIFKPFCEWFTSHSPVRFALDVDGQRFASPAVFASHLLDLANRGVTASGERFELGCGKGFDVSLQVHRPSYGRDIIKW